MNLQYDRLTDEHSTQLSCVWADREVIRWINVEKPCTLEEICQRVSVLKQFDVFVVLEDAKLIGIIGCPCVDAETNTFGLFYQFCKGSWGKGIASEAAAWLVGYMKNKYGECTLLADVVETNIASEKILQKLEFSFVSEEDGFCRDGEAYKVRNFKLEV